MKRAFAFGLALALGGACLPLRADDVLPRPAAGDRYAKMAERSPFAPPTPVSAVAAPAAPVAGPKWSDQLAVTMLMQQGGVFFATITNKANSEHYLLQSDREDTERQMALASVQWGDVIEQTTVTLRHNNEFAPVRFEPGAATAAPAPGGPMPGRGPGPGGLQPPPRAGFQPPRPGVVPPTPPNTANLVNRQAPIRTSPAALAPAIHPPPAVTRRPLATKDDDDDE